MIILINGPINSGKTTVSKELAKTVPGTAHIEVDSLRDFIRCMELKESIPINIENTILVAKNLLRRDLNLVISYVLTKEVTAKLVKSLKGIDAEIYYFTLSPTATIALSNRGHRELTASEKKRIKYHYLIGVNKPGFGVIIDNTKLSVEGTVAEIMENIRLRNTLNLSIFA